MEIALGWIVVLATVVALVARIIRSRGGTVGRLPLTTAGRQWTMVVLCIISGVFVLPAIFPTLRRGIFAFCSICPIAAPAATGTAGQTGFLDALMLAAWYYAATVLPVFVLACLASGALKARSGRFQVRGILGSFGLAAVLPVCSCGVVPLTKTMIDRGGTGPRDGLVFLATAPLLSPVIISLALTMLGPTYTLARIAASLVMAVAIAFVVRPFLVRRAPEPGQEPCVDASTCGGVGRGSPPATSDSASGSVTLAGWFILASLVRYVLYGIVLGAFITAALPPQYVGALLQTGPLSLATAVVVGVPINMCAGEEILLTSPLVGMGFGLGQALAFALASTGICLSSIPLLAAVLGKKATLVMVLLYIVLPFAIGVIVNALPLSTRFGPAPF